MRKWVNGNHPSSSSTSESLHRTYQMTSGPTVYPQKYRRYLPARLRAVWIQPLTSQTKFSKSPFPLQRASHVRRPTTQPGCLSALRELTRQIVSLRASQTRSRSHSRNRTSNTPNYHSAPSDICWYHLKFRDQARKCTLPCSRQQRKPRKQREAPHQNDSRHQENSSSGR